MEQGGENWWQKGARPITASSLISRAVQNFPDTCSAECRLGTKGKKWVLLARTAHNVFVKIMAFQTVKTMLAERMYYSECSNFFFFVEREGNTFKIDLK